jgi:hypothetical protein
MEKLDAINVLDASFQSNFNRNTMSCVFICENLLDGKESENTFAVRDSMKRDGRKKLTPLTR